MAKVIDIKPPAKAPEKTDLAAAVAPKLEAARVRLAELEAHVGAAALAASLEEVGSQRVTMTVPFVLRLERDYLELRLFLRV